MTAIQLVWSPLARRDLLEIYVAIGLESPMAAERYFNRIEAVVGLLIEQPRLGVRRADIRAAVRMLVERPYLILYEAQPESDQEPVDRIEIVRVVDGRRDLSNLF